MKIIVRLGPLSNSALSGALLRMSHIAALLQKVAAYSKLPSKFKIGTRILTTKSSSRLRAKMIC